MLNESEIEKLQKEIKILKQQINDSEHINSNQINLTDSFHLLNNINQIIFLVDQESQKIVFCNKLFIEEFGEYTGKKYWEVYSDHKGKSSEAHGIKITEYVNHQTIFLSKKTDKWYDIENKKLQLSDGKSYILESLNVVSKDSLIDEESEKKFKALFNNSQDAIFFIDELTGIIIDTNLAGIKLLNKDYEDIIGLKQTEIFPIKIKSDKNFPKNFEWILTSDKREIPVIVSEKKIIMDNKPILLVVYRDISEINKYSEELIRANKKVDVTKKSKLEFIENLSHEMRTPLNAILGYSQILLRNSNLSFVENEYVNVIKHSGDFLLSTIDNLILMAKFEVGKKRLDKNPFNLLSLINDVNHQIKIKADKKSLEYEYEILGQIPEMVVGDKLILTQVLLNLLNNAVKYTSKGKVIFRVGYHDDKIRFQIEDTGIGIPEEYKEEVFIAQSTFDSNYHSEGTGLGLSICKQQVELMGGELKMKSRLNVGSLFWFDIKLPSIEVEQEMSFELDKIIIGYEGEKRKVLIVDDDEDNRILIQRMLQPLNFIVHQANNGIDAIDKAVKSIPDIILISEILSGLSGFETARLLINEEKLSKAKIIAISSDSEDTYKDDYLSAGCNDFINKPIRYEVLLDKIEEHLQLNWLYKEGFNPFQFPDKLVTPRKDILLPIYNAIKSNDLDLLRKELDEIKHIEKEYIPFFEITKNLLKNFRIKGLHDFIEKYVNSSNVK